MEKTEMDNEELDTAEVIVVDQDASLGSSLCLPMLAEYLRIVMGDPRLA